MKRLIPSLGRRKCLLLAALLAFGVCQRVSQAQTIGQTVNTCSSGWTDYSNYIEQTTCLYGDQNGVTAYVDTEDDGYEYIGGLNEVIVGVESDPQVYDSNGNLVYDAGVGESAGVFTPQIDMTYTLQGLYDECYDPTASGDWQTCYWQGPIDGFNVQAEVTGPPTLVDPAYQVTSIVYAPPGNKSTAGFTTSTTNGKTTTMGHSFTNSNTIAFSEHIPIFGPIGGSTQTFGGAYSNTSSNAVQEQFSDATSIANSSVSSNPNTANHAQDLFVIWLNPEVTVQVYGNDDPASYSTGTQLDSNGNEEAYDMVEVTASTMQPNASGQSTVDPSILNPQVVPSPVNGQPTTLPGLASICKNLNVQQYQSGACTLGGQCGCTPSDFAGILSEDPMLNYNGTGAPYPGYVSPLEADVSGASACLTPNSLLDCRYVPVAQSSSNPNPQFTTLAGPQCSGCNIPVNGYTQTDSTNTTVTLGGSTSHSVATQFKFGTNIFSVAVTNTLTWQDSESTGTLSGTSNSMSMSLSSSTVGCSEDVNVFEDTIFHTFLFQEPVSNTCP